MSKLQKILLGLGIVLFIGLGIFLQHYDINQRPAQLTKISQLEHKTTLKKLHPKLKKINQPLLKKTTNKEGFSIALQHLGQSQYNNSSSLTRFMGVNPNSQAWCADFVNACERAAGHPGTHSAMARSFLGYGHKVSLHEARRGDIVVFSSLVGGGAHTGHVTYFDSLVGNGRVRCLGGNQSHMVRYKEYPVSKIIEIRRYGN